VLWERSVVEQRYNAVREVLAAALPVTEVADRYGVSRQSVHAWINRYRAGGLDGLKDRSHLSAYTFTCRLAYGLTCRSSCGVSIPVRLS
jgi:transposase-like protein